MPGERSGSGPSSAGFSAAWCATDLGEYRACRYTYERYPYESLPPLDSTQFTGTFQWLGGVGDHVPGQVTKLTGLAADLTASGLRLPQDFITFQTSSNLYGSLDEVSVTGCWTDISEPLPSPVEPGAFLVRFLRDQQDCVIWYLYLRPGAAFVVHSHLDYEYEYEARRDGEQAQTDLDDGQEQRAAIFWCAPSFEEFAHRFWVENRLWRAVHGGDLSRLEPQLRDYLRHYAPPEVLALPRVVWFAADCRAAGPNWVGEDQSALLGEPEQRPDRDGRGAELVAAQRIQHGSDVVGADLTEVAAVCCPAAGERLDGREVDVDAGVRAGWARASPSSSTSSQARTAPAKPWGSSPARRSIQQRTAGMLSSSSRSSPAKTSATRGTEI